MTFLWWFILFNEPLKIHDGGFDAPVIQTVCNFEIPNPVFSTGNRISFHAFANLEQSYNSNAYDITYTSSKSGK